MIEIIKRYNEEYKFSDIHLKDKLRITKDQALERAIETVTYAKQHGLNIRFTVEDGSRAESLHAPGTATLT